MCNCIRVCKYLGNSAVTRLSKIVPPNRLVPYRLGVYTCSEAGGEEKRSTQFPVVQSILIE